MHGELAICTSRVLRKKGILARRERLRVQLKKTLARKFAKWITSMREDKMKKEIDGKSTLKSKGDLTLLHEDCFAHVISFTSPRNACILSLVSSSFRAGVDSDATWKHFLPSDYASLLSRAVHPVQYASLKDLFLQLCDRPVLIDGGKLSFGLNKSTGAKCFTIPAYEMDLPEYKDSTNIDWELVSRVLSPPDKERTMSYYANHTDWEFVSLSNSRFHKGVKLTAHLHVGHNALSDQTFLSFVSINGLIKCEKKVFLRPPRNPSEIARRKHCLIAPVWSSENCRTIIRDFVVMWPKERTDGWMEVEIGEFYNENGEDREVEIKLYTGKDRAKIAVGTVFLGIELRPKESVN